MNRITAQSSEPAASPATPDPDRDPSEPDSWAWSDRDLATDPHANAEKAAKVRAMFGAIAHRYDLNNRLHSFGRDQAWRRAAVRLAGVGSDDVVLDIACGTGDLARAFRKAGVKKVIGADFTPRMLDIARAREQNASPGDRIEYVEADAQALPFEDASVDVVSIAFGIRNVMSPERALSEFHRVLRPGGRLVILEFDRPRLKPIAWANDLYCGVIMPRTATLISGDRSGAYKYLPKSVRTFHSRAEMADLMLRAGFGDVRQKPLTFGVCVCHFGRRRETSPRS